VSAAAARPRRAPAMTVIGQYRTFRHRIRRVVMSRFADIHTAAAANVRLHSKRMHSRRIALN